MTLNTRNYHSWNSKPNEKVAGEQKCEKLKYIKRKIRKCIIENKENMLDNQLKKMESTKDNSNQRC